MRIGRTVSIFPVVTLAAVLFTTPVRADDSRVARLTPQVQALLNELSKMEGAQPAPEAAPTPAPAMPATPAPTAPVSSPAPATGLKRVATLTATALRTGALGTSRLMPSAPLSGRGLTGGAPRLSADDWRQLFPLQDLK
jgi:hypothetical protein